MTKYLVLGGGGFIGRHVVRHLARTGCDVTAVTHKVNPDFGSNVKAVFCDLTNATSEQFDEMIASVDVIFHFSWTSIPASANSSPIDDLYHNGRMTLELLEALKRRGEGRLVFASSGGTVYGRLRTIPVREDHPLDPVTAYGVSKLACEKYIQIYNYLHNIDARIVRIANPYGAGQNPLRQQGVVSTFVFRAINNSQIEIWGDGNTVRDFIYITDLVECLMKVANKSRQSPGVTDIYNIGGGEHHSINDVVELIETFLGRKIAVSRRSTRAFDIPVSLLDINKARSELFWEVKVPLQEGIRRTIKNLEKDPFALFTDDPDSF